MVFSECPMAKRMAIVTTGRVAIIYFQIGVLCEKKITRKLYARHFIIVSLFKNCA